MLTRDEKISYPVSWMEKGGSGIQDVFDPRSDFFPSRIPDQNFYIPGQHQKI